MNEFMSILCLWVVEIFSAYIITTVFVGAHNLEKFRAFCRKHFRFLSSRVPTNGQAGFTHVHMVDCQLCMGLWISLAVCYYYGDLQSFLLVYGVSYFIATRKRI